MPDSRGAELTRRELYNRVWREPMVNVAKDFGLSDRGLAKICERAAIPVPPRGYWAKKAAGKRVVRPPLLELGGSDSSAKFRISPYWRTAKPTDSCEQGQQPNAAARFRELAEAELQEIKRIPAPATLRDAHRLVAKWIEEEQRDRASWAGNSYRRQGSNNPNPIERRRRRLLSALLRALEARGFTAEQGTYRSDLSVRFEQDKVTFEMSERIRQRRVRLTEDEQARRNTKQVWTQTKEPTGELALKITSGMPAGLPSSWQDEADSPLEQQLHLVVVGFVVATAYGGERREQREEAERQRRREEEEARKREDCARQNLRRRKRCDLEQEPGAARPNCEPMWLPPNRRCWPTNWRFNKSKSSNGLRGRSPMRTNSIQLPRIGHSQSRKRSLMSTTNTGLTLPNTRSPGTLGSESHGGGDFFFATSVKFPKMRLWILDPRAPQHDCIMLTSHYCVLSGAWSSYLRIGAARVIIVISQIAVGFTLLVPSNAASSRPSMKSIVPNWPRSADIPLETGCPGRARISATRDKC